MKKTVILTIGAPGSGKSTWAESYAKPKDKRIVVLCRDDLRSMIGATTYKYSREFEQLVMTTMLSMLKLALNDSVTNEIVIADTNLSASTRAQFEKVVDEYNSDKLPDDQAPIIHKLFDEHWTILVDRNAKRGIKSVPMPVLRSMYLNMQKFLGHHKEYVPNTDLPKAVIFDLDGTLANNSHRRPFDYEKLIDDKVNEHVANLLNMYKNNGYKIIFVSGRNAGNKENITKYFDLTMQWANNNNLHCDALFMRDWNSFIPDDIVKENIFWRDIAPSYNVEIAFDDRDRVVEMWRRIGVKCAQVDFGEF